MTTTVILSPSHRYTQPFVPNMCGSVAQRGNRFSLLLIKKKKILFFCFIYMRCLILSISFLDLHILIYTHHSKMALFESTQKTGLGGLFSKSSAIDSRELMAKKQRTTVEIPEDIQERGTAAKAARAVATASAQRVERQQLSEQASEPVVHEKRSKKRKRTDDNENLEEDYINKLLDEPEEVANEKTGEAAVKNSDDSSDDEDEEEESTDKSASGQEAKQIDFKGAELDKAERTLFIGNVPLATMSDKKITKQFKRVFSEFGKLESIRFRSIGFNSNLPRKFAYITKSFKDESKDEIVNSYVVFKEKSESLKASNSLNGHIFMDHHLRVDHLTHPLKQDNKKSIFIGNLEFEEKEESLWKFFNQNLIDASDKEETKSIVDNVRIIRDPKTNFGKGFAIVQFVDSIYVDKSLLLNNKELSTSNRPIKRRLRISRCKNNPQQSNNSRFGNNSKLNEKQRTIIGRGKKVLNKSDRSTIGRTVTEGYRAKRGDNVKGIKNGIGGKRGPSTKKPRHQGGRVAQRAKAHRDTGKPKSS